MKHRYSERLILLGTLIVIPLAIAEAGTVHGTVMNGTTGKATAGIDLVLIQLQGDPWRMPIENAAVRWSETESVPEAVAELVLPPQRFDSAAQLAFAANLAYNPWHSLPEHRPLGNQNRARRTIYLELSRLRQRIDGEAHIEPTGEETF